MVEGWQLYISTTFMQRTEQRRITPDIIDDLDFLIKNDLLVRSSLLKAEVERKILKIQARNLIYRGVQQSIIESENRRTTEWDDGLDLV